MLFLPIDEHFWPFWQYVRLPNTIRLKKTLDLLTHTEFTSASCPKNVCFGLSSRISHSLQVLSTLPVTKVFPSGDKLMETTSPLCALKSEVFLPVSKSHLHLKTFVNLFNSMIGTENLDFFIIFQERLYSRRHICITVGSAHSYFLHCITRVASRTYYVERYGLLLLVSISPMSG